MLTTNALTTDRDTRGTYVWFLPQRHPSIHGFCARARNLPLGVVFVCYRLSVLFSQSGQVVNSSIDGCIQMKSYLSGELWLLRSACFSPRNLRAISDTADATCESTQPKGGKP